MHEPERGIPGTRGIGGPIRILHVIHTLRVGGLENGVVNVISHSDPARFRHDVCCVTESGPLAARLPAGRTSVYELHKGPGHDWAVFPRLRRLLVKIRPHIVHTRNWSTLDLVVAARWAAVPAVVHGEHGWDAANLSGTRRKANFIRRLLAPMTDRWIAVSEDIHRWLVTEVKIQPSKVVTIRNGVDTDRFRPRERHADSANSEPSTLVIGTVGRLDPVKAQADLVAAFAKLAPRHGGLRLAITGDGPLRENLEQAIRRLGLSDRTRFLGEVARPEEAYAALDVFILPSLREGISNTILEAMAAGLPVVATRVGGNPELVEDGVTGMLIPASDVDALAAAIERYVREPGLKAAHGSAGRARVEEAFSIRGMVRRYEELYDALYEARVVRKGDGAGRRSMPPVAP